MALLLAVALSVHGCVQHDDTPDGPQAGNGDVSLGSEGGERSWTIAEQPDLTLGEGDPEEPEMVFWEIAGLITLPDGRIVVGHQRGPPELRFFTGDGEFLQRVGSQGEGPGEFGRVRSIWLAAPDTLIVWDAGSHRIARFTTAGDHLSTQGQVGARALWGRFADGTFLQGPSGIPLNRSGIRVGELGRDSITVERITEDGEVVARLGPFPHREWIGVEGGLAPIPLFARPTFFLVSGASLYVGVGDDYLIERYGPTGDHIQTIRKEHEPQPITPELRESWMAEQIARLPPEAQAQQRRAVESMFRPGHLPAFGPNWGREQTNDGRWWVVDSGGNLWVPPYVLPDDEVAIWSVFDAEGSWIVDLPMPVELFPREIGEGHVLGIWKDQETGVQSVRRYALTR